MKKIILFLSIFSMLSCGGNPAQQWDALQRDIRDGTISKQAALAKIKILHAEFSTGSPCSNNDNAFPVYGYGIKDIGGSSGSGYIPGKYDFYDGDSHTGHPAHDIFIRDSDQDGLDDNTGKATAVLSFSSGVIVGINTNWSQQNDCRGGNYIWVFDPSSQAYFYYAHLSDIAVKIGQRVCAGDTLGLLGRSGTNAAKDRSPTHLHFMALNYSDGKMLPKNTFSDLKGIFATVEKKRLPWVTGEFITKRIAHIPAPNGFSRIDVTSKSFGEFLRELPLKKGKAVYLFDGRKKANQRAQYAVIDIDVGKRDLQQCADAIMRLRAEYLYYHERYDEISFNFVSGFKCSFEKWSKGFGVKIQGNKVLWKDAPKNDTGYASFKRYLIMVFSYANTSSLEKEMTAVTDPSRMEIGDIFIQGGFPGHAVIIVDIAVNDRGEKIFLLGQSYMPAQDFHILNSPDRISPWHVIPENGILETPEWEFHIGDLKRF
ncbi:peptidoglycan DD-metalloendopeptidase family protein [bacterium]|nr:peptidoglycan DD-metalloendopeptidase family protein [bacterium]